MNNEALNRYSIEDDGDFAVIYLNDEHMVSFDSEEEFISKFREVYNLTEKDKMKQYIRKESDDITEYFSNKSDNEVNKLLLLELKYDGLDLESHGEELAELVEPTEEEPELTEEEIIDLSDICESLIFVLLDYQKYIVYSSNGEKDLVDELTKQFRYDYESITTYHDLSDMLVHKFLSSKEVEIYNKHVYEYERTNPRDERDWLKAQYYVYLAGLRLARKVVSGDI